MPHNMDSSCTWCCGVEVPGGSARWKCHVEVGRTQHHGWSCPEPRKCYMEAPHGSPTRIFLRRKIYPI